jgi:hypothetical protein
MDRDPPSRVGAPDGPARGDLPGVERGAAVTYDLTIERIVDAPAELVFATIVDPAAQDEIFAHLVDRCDT